jgi:hypothetical protein
MDRRREPPVAVDRLGLARQQVGRDGRPADILRAGPDCERLRGADPMTVQLDREQRELAEFIRAGSGRGPQCFGSYFDERGGSCALGAVYEGVYHLPRDHGRLVPQHLERLFRCLDELTKRCPRGCQKRLPLAAMIVHLNDDHRLSREEIAEWLVQESGS